MKNGFENLPDVVKQHISSTLPKEKRLMAAKAQISVYPKELILVLYWLTKDIDEDVRKEAEISLNLISQDALSSFLEDESAPPQILDYVARTSSIESLVEKIILNKTTDDRTIAFLAENTAGQNLISLIANNHERVLRSQEIIEAIGRNASVGRNTIDILISCVTQYLDKRENSHDLFGEDLSQQSDPDGEDSSTSTEDLENEIETYNPIGVQQSFLDEISISEDLVKESEEEVSERKRESLLFKIKGMNTSERIKLALLGNRESRSILVRESNKLVSRTVLRNPRLSDGEVVLISQSKVVDEEILREISESRKWIRLYQVKLSLVSNPKTPSHISLNLIRHLRDRDLRMIMNDKNIPGIVTSSARRIVKERESKGG